MLEINPQNGELKCTETGLCFADLPYCYAIKGSIDVNTEIFDVKISDKKIIKTGTKGYEIKGLCKNTNIEVLHILSYKDSGIKETITIKNLNECPIKINDVKFGMVAEMVTRPDWKLCSIPFKVQLDGSSQEYTTEMLIKGEFKNAVYSDPFRPEPPLIEEKRIRSEAFAWMLENKGITVIKYNNDNIELSVAFPETKNNSSELCFGGAGLCLYGEPMNVRELAPGQNFTFGETYYIPFSGGFEQAYYTYREFIEDRGHGHPVDYNPPLTWNELYDIGWYHSDTKALIENYNKEAILKEAELAKECNCELLYLDPGWEVAEGATIWDETRLGTVAELIETLKNEYGLDFGYRTILRSYTNHFDTKYIRQPEPGKEKKPVNSGPPGLIWEYCLCNPEFFNEKLKRILAISKQGVKFMMFDEMDWRGYCYALDHGHSNNARPLDHVKAVYDLAKAVKTQCPGLVAEVHDPIWPWCTSLYVPTYFKQGFGDLGSYQENWGFEYMWNCMEDLKSGKALSLYYYNLGSNIPLYLHITMAADNDNCLFFWWCASTVRHLGIGGKYSHKSVEDFEGGLQAYEHEKRFDSYKQSTKVYRRLKPYFSRGRFWGLAENIHFHTLPGTYGGVLAMFNLTEDEKILECLIPTNMLGTDNIFSIKDTSAKWTPEGVQIKVKLKPMSPHILFLGDDEE